MTYKNSILELILTDTYRRTSLQDKCLQMYKKKTFHVTILTQVIIGILDLWNASTYLSISPKFLTKSSNSTYRPHRPIVCKIWYMIVFVLYFSLCIQILYKLFNVFINYLCLQIKAAVRTVNPREEKYMKQEPKFKISVSIQSNRSLLWFMVFNAIFNNISVITWWSALLLKKLQFPEKTIDLLQVTDNFITYCCIKYTSPEQGSNSQHQW